MGLWVRLINDPVERTGADFIHFYSAGRVAQEYGFSRVYDLKLQQNFEQEQVGFVLAPGQIMPFNHLPYLIPLLRLVMSKNYIASFYRWDAIMIVLFILALFVLSRSVKKPGLERISILIAAIGGILFLPVFVSLQNGQDTAILFLGAAIWVYGLLSGKDLLAGLGLSLTTVRPHIALLLAIPILFRYRKVLLGFLLGSGALAVFSVLILGANGMKQFIDVLLLTAGGNWYGTHQEAMLNLIGLLLRTLPIRAEIIRGIGWAFYGLTLIFLCILWSRKTDLQDGRIGLTITLIVFAVPHLHFHDLSLLLIPIYELIRFSAQGRFLKKETALVLPIAVSLILLLSNAAFWLHYTIPYLIMLALALYPFYSKRMTTSAAPHQA
jgi:hypothetical protein